jgi:hypothetical protein
MAGMMKETGHRWMGTFWMEGPTIQRSRRRRPRVGGSSIAPPTNDDSRGRGRGVNSIETNGGDRLAYSPLNRLFSFLLPCTEEPNEPEKSCRRPIFHVTGGASERYYLCMVVSPSLRDEAGHKDVGFEDVEEL